jgi:hypothetical protein
MAKKKHAVPLPAREPSLHEFDENLTRKEILERFKNLFGREMTAIERKAFVLPQEEKEEKTGE